MDYIWFTVPRGTDRTGYHLSKAVDESYYILYDINPYSDLNTLQFCRKNDIHSLIKQSPSCYHKSCSSKCVNITLPGQSDDTRFGFYACMPKNSLAGIVYTQSFPKRGDFIRPNLPMNYSVALRRNFNQSLTLSFELTDENLPDTCYEYVNFDLTSTLNDTIRLNCHSATTNNITMTDINFKKDFNGLISLALQNRRMSGHHTRFIDYQLCKNYLKRRGTILFDFMFFIDDDRCRYQGIYHPYINQCICAPSFYGDECQYSKKILFLSIINTEVFKQKLAHLVIMDKLVIIVVMVMTTFVKVY